MSKSEQLCYLKEVFHDTSLEFRSNGWLGLEYNPPAWVSHQELDIRLSKVQARSLAKSLLVYADGEVPHWNTASFLPTPSIPLTMKLSCGSIVEGTRPKYIADRAGSKGYQNNAGKDLPNVVEWTYQ